MKWEFPRWIHPRTSLKQWGRIKWTRVPTKEETTLECNWNKEVIRPHCQRITWLKSLSLRRGPWYFLGLDTHKVRTYGPSHTCIMALCTRWHLACKAVISGGTNNYIRTPHDTTYRRKGLRHMCKVSHVQTGSPVHTGTLPAWHNILSVQMNNSAHPVPLCTACTTVQQVGRQCHVLAWSI